MCFVVQPWFLFLSVYVSFCGKLIRKNFNHVPGDVCMLASYFCVRLYLYLLLHCANNILKIEPDTHFEDRTTHSKRFVVMNAGIWTVYLSKLSWWCIEILRVNSVSFLVMVIFIHQIFRISVSASAILCLLCRVISPPCLIDKQVPPVHAIWSAREISTEMLVKDSFTFTMECNMF